MGNSEKEAEQVKIKILTSQSKQTNQNSETIIEKQKFMLNNASELKDVRSDKSGNHVKE